jgi:hypothetical protein
MTEGGKPKNELVQEIAQVAQGEPIWEIANYSSDEHLQAALKSANELVRRSAAGSSPAVVPSTLRPHGASLEIVAALTL